MGGTLGRYASVIITTIIFVILVVTVLAVNFNLSFQTEANAEVVNVAGRQRMLSQRVAKSFGNVRSRAILGQSYEQQFKELNGAANLFNTVILAFKQGGEIQSTKSGITFLEAVPSQDGEVIVDKGLEIWQPLYDSISKLSQNAASSDLNQTDLNRIQVYIDQNINSLLSLMNDLTNYQEGLANEAADTSRLIQTVGIIASLLCFAVIMYLIFGQLQSADRAAQNARKETERIFETVDQGLFLINSDLSIGSERSKALERIFSSAELDGKNFKDFIKELVSNQDLDNIDRYLKLLFDPHKKQRLLKDLNPLNRVALQVNENNKLINKYLNFSFSRVFDGDDIVGVLTSVSDITREIRLAEELELETRRNAEQMEMLSALMSADSKLLPEFIDNSDQSYQQINNLLKVPSKTRTDFKNKATSITQLIHKIKGESAAIGLGFIADLCHDFEDQVQILLEKPEISGEEFLSLTVLLDKLISLNNQITAIFDTILGRIEQDGSEVLPIVDDSTQTSLKELAQTIAKRQEKKVSLSLAGFDGIGVPSKIKLDLVSLASQLLRNAIAHGIETPDSRKGEGKSETGNISIALFEHGSDGYRLICEDDGAGIDFDALTKKAIEEGLMSEQQLSSTSRSEIINLLLSKPLSTKDSSDEDAGRGLGMTVIGDLVKKMGGKVSLSTKMAKGTRFTINIPQIDVANDMQQGLSGVGANA